MNYINLKKVFGISDVGHLKKKSFISEKRVSSSYRGNVKKIYRYRHRFCGITFYAHFVSSRIRTILDRIRPLKEPDQDSDPALYKFCINILHQNILLKIVENFFL
jgi:hypothetical protein